MLKKYILGVFILCINVLNIANAQCGGTPPTVTTQPANITAACAGSPGSFDIAATGSATITYQWQENSGSGFANLSGASGIYTGVNTATLTITKIATTMNNRSYRCNVDNGCAPSATSNVAVLNVHALTANTSSTPVCPGASTGSASVSVTAGTTPYTYFWPQTTQTTATITGLTAGNYTCNITDALCTLQKEVIVLANGPFSVTIGHSDVLCYGTSTGNAYVSPIGSGSFTYNWLPLGGTGTNASNIPAGTYSCTVTDHGFNCALTKTVTVSQPTALSIVTGSTDVLCYGDATGSATVTVSGGIPSYRYSWSPSGGTNTIASNLTAKGYTCTVTDANNCTITAMPTIAQPAAITATASQSDILCNGTATTSADVTVSGGTFPYSYSWIPIGGSSSSATNLTAGSYTVNITDNNNCFGTTTVTIVNSTPTLTLTVSKDTACANSGIINLTGNPFGGIYSGTGVTGNSFNTNTVSTGTYTVSYTYTNSAGCSNMATATILIDDCTGISVIDLATSKVIVYPNPFNTATTIEIENGSFLNTQLEIYDGLGRLMKNTLLTQAKTTITRDNLPAGVYFYRVLNTTNLIAKGTLVIE